jgi:hypothetical protein
LACNKKHDLGTHAQTSGNGNTLLLAARKLIRVGVRLVCESDAPQNLAPEPFGFLLFELSHFDGSDSDVCKRRHMRVEIELLEDETDFGAQPGHVGLFLVNPHTVDDEFTLFDPFQAVDATDQGALARTAGTTNHHHFPGIDVQIDVLQNVELSKPLIHACKPYHSLLSSPREDDPVPPWFFEPKLRTSYRK